MTTQSNPAAQPVAAHISTSYAHIRANLRAVEAFLSNKNHEEAVPCMLNLCNNCMSQASVLEDAHASDQGRIAKLEAIIRKLLCESDSMNRGIVLEARAALAKSQG